ncbi:hypothetical protein UK82_10675 [Frankia sp. ACN1ag]|nr:hypothetical protein UK82_10675 [Frankia sp. ACN1ag]
MSWVNATQASSATGSRPRTLTAGEPTASPAATSARIHTRYCGLSTRAVTTTTTTSARARPASVAATVRAVPVSAGDRPRVHHHTAAAMMATASTRLHAVATARATGPSNCREP